MKKKNWLTMLAVASSLLAAGLVVGEPQASRNPGLYPSASESKISAAGQPLLGFASEPGSPVLHPITGTASHPTYASPLAAPAGIGRIYLPPRQRYALLESASGSSLSVWNLERLGLVPAERSETVISNAPAHPEMVAFSPTGEAAALVSAGEGRVQAIVGLPAQPRILRELPTRGRGVSALAVTDDGELLVALFNDDIPYYSFAGSAWLPVSTAVRPHAWLFLPHSHSLAVSDSARNEIVILPKVNDTPIAERVLAGSVDANQLAVTSDADELLAASARTATVWEIPLTEDGSSSRRVSFASVGPLSLLRDGHAVLLSSFPELTLLRATASQLHIGH